MNVSQMQYGVEYIVETSAGFKFKCRPKYTSDYENLESMSKSTDIVQFATNHTIIKNDDNTPGTDYGDAKLKNHFKNKKIVVCQVTQVIYQPVIFLEKGKDTPIWEEIRKSIKPATADYRYLLTIKVNENTDLSKDIKSRIDTALKTDTKLAYDLDHISYNANDTDFYEINNEIMLEKYQKKLNAALKEFNTLIEKSTVVSETLNIGELNKKIDVIKQNVNDITEAIERYIT